MTGKILDFGLLPYMLPNNQIVRLSNVLYLKNELRLDIDFLNVSNKSFGLGLTYVDMPLFPQYYKSIIYSKDQYG